MPKQLAKPKKVKKTKKDRGISKKKSEVKKSKLQEERDNEELEKEIAKLVEEKEQGKRKKRAESAPIPVNVFYSFCVIMIRFLLTYFLDQNT